MLQNSQKNNFIPFLCNYTYNPTKLTKNHDNGISDVSAVCLQFPNFIAINKIRPYFKSARQADSKYAKIFTEM